MPNHKPSWQSRLLRPLWAGLTSRVGAFATPQALNATQRTWANHPFLPRGVTLQKVTARGVPAEWLIPKAADGILLYLHGGAWTLGYYQPHRWLVVAPARPGTRLPPGAGAPLPRRAGGLPGRLPLAPQQRHLAAADRHRRRLGRRQPHPHHHARPAR
jgi:hypothetical protein